MAKKKKISVRLPNKLHAMLTKALDDVERLEKSKRYKINMYIAAHRPATGEPCEVCLAGSQLVGKLPRGEFELWFDDSRISKSLSDKLCALDHLRQGEVVRALSQFKDIPEDRYSEMDRQVAGYHDNPKLWKAQMRLLAVELEQANL